ncbi:MAG: hypothetical protein P4L84_24230, partial [Isosphaeraceae bacterium]|nr:hypothetical protein [Isosphaeraceae bacterium]
MMSTASDLVRRALWLSGLLYGLGHSGLAVAAERPPADETVSAVSLFEGLRAGTLKVAAEGSSNGKMVLSVENVSPRSLRVVLPPGLVASGATGQFGGGGFGGAGGGGF